MTILVSTGGQSTPIHREVFVALFDNSVVYDRSAYRKALERGTIPLEELIALARKAEVPYPLLFAPPQLVHAQLASKTRKLLQGVTKKQFSLSARGRVELRDIELIVKDLLRKQELYKRHVGRLEKNPIVGCISRPRNTESAAATILETLDLTSSTLQAQKNKGAALELLIRQLESRHVLVSRSVQGYMPQRLTKAKFSGITIRDSKAPFIFLTGGDHGEQEEPTGRQLFTLALLAVLIGRRKFRVVTMSTTTLLDAPPTEYVIAAEMLMPRQQVQLLDLSSLENVREAAETLKVTPSALVVRAQHLRLLDHSTAGGYLEEQAADFRARPSRVLRQPKPVNAVTKYNGRAFTRAMLSAVDTGAMSPGEFCRVVGGRRIGPGDLAALGRVVR